MTDECDLGFGVFLFYKKKKDGGRVGTDHFLGAVFIFYGGKYSRFDYK